MLPGFGAFVKPFPGKMLVDGDVVPMPVPAKLLDALKLPKGDVTDTVTGDTAVANADRMSAVSPVDGFVTRPVLRSIGNPVDAWKTRPVDGSNATPVLGSTSTPVVASTVMFARVPSRAKTGPKRGSIPTAVKNSGGAEANADSGRPGGSTLGLMTGVDPDPAEPGG